MGKYNWAIIGTGWAASDMASALNKENCEIYAVVNPHKDMLINLQKISCKKSIL